jgi:hypothetical protein
MNFENKAEMEFWKAAFLACLSCDNVATDDAAKWADESVEALRGRIPGKPLK